MKLIVHGKELAIVSEGEAEQKKLTEVFLANFFKSAAPATPTVSKATASRKRPLHKKKCVDCNRMFKGLQGLNKHRNSAHKRMSTYEGMTRIPVESV